MRCKGVIIALGLALLTSGCYTADGVYLREGVGTAVPANDIIAVTNIQEIYFGEICRQAGLNVRQTQDGALLCDEMGMPPPAWTVFVQAGMNDIDRRCDAYLAWLDNRRRWREPALKQLHSTAAVTAAIMGLTGASAASIAIVGAAFGFAQETFVNLSGRLITEVNQSTVQSLVLTRQNEYRVGLKGRVIPNKPAALYALRSYLRLCMPMTIETEINNTVMLAERGGGAAIDAGERNRMIAPGTAAVTPVIRVDRPPPATPPPPQVMGGVLSRVEGVISLGSGRAIQKALCVSETGTFDPATRTALKDFKAAALYPTDSQATDILETDADLRRLRSAQQQFPSCQGAGLRNAYEVGLFARFGARKMRSDLGLALEAAGLPVPAGLTSATGAIADNTVRQAITALRQKYGLPGQPVIDRAFYDTMLNSMTR